MFEDFENRRKQRSSWKTFAVVTSIAAVVVVVGLKLHDQARTEADHEEHRLQREAERRPSEVELPGMTIVGPGPATQQGDYEHGVLAGTTPVDFAVQWQRHGTMPIAATLLELVVNAYDKGSHWSLARVSNRELQVGGLPAHEAAMR